MFFHSLLFLLTLLICPCVPSDNVKCKALSRPCPSGREGIKTNPLQHLCCPRDFKLINREPCRCAKQSVYCSEGNESCNHLTNKVELGEMVWCCPDGYAEPLIQVSPQGKKVEKCRCHLPGDVPFRRNRLSESTAAEKSDPAGPAEESVDKNLQEPIYTPYYIEPGVLVPQ